MMIVADYQRYLPRKGRTSLLKKRAKVPTRSAASNVPSRTPPREWRKTNDRIREIATREQSTETFAVPNRMLLFPEIANDSPSPASGTVSEATSAETPIATSTIPMRQNSSDSA